MSHQFNREPVRPDLSLQPSTESLIRMRPMSSVGPQTQAAHSLHVLRRPNQIYQHISPTIHCDRITPQAQLKWIQQYTTAMQTKDGGWRGVGLDRKPQAMSREEVTLL